MNKLLSIFIFLFFNSLSGQVNYQQSPYESMYDSDQKEIIKIWQNYLEFTRGVPKGNCLLWEKNPFTKQNNCNLLSTQGFYNPSLFSLGFNNQTLSITKIDDVTYNIRSIFYNISKDNFSPFAIINVLAKKDENGFLLKDFLPFYTQNWKETKLGKITYHYKEGYSLNFSKAEEANSLLNHLVDLFEINEHIEIQYFISDDCEEVTKIVGFEYIPTQNALSVTNCAFFDSDNNIIYTTKNNGENHKHELVHIINKKYPNAHYLLTSGLSIYSNQKNVHIGNSFNVLFNKFVTYYSINKNEKPTLFGASKIGENINVDYLLGAILIDAILEKNQIKGLREAFSKLTNEEEIYKYLKSNFNVDKKNESEWLFERAKKLSNEKYKFRISL